MLASNNRIRMQKKQVGRLYLIWGAIVITVLGAMWFQSSRGEGDETPDGTVPAQAEVAPVGMEAELTGKVVLLFERLRRMSPALTSDLVLQNARPLSDENAAFVDRLAYTVLVGKVESWETAIEEAKALGPASDAEGALRDALVSVMEERAFGHMTGAETGHDRFVADADERAAVLDKLGFFGRVACDAPGVAAEAARAGAAMLAVLGWYALAFCIGCVTLVFTLIWLFRKPAAPIDESGAREHTALVLGETFAVWMVCFLAMNYGAGVLGETLVDAFGLDGTPRAVHVGLACAAAGFFGSLVALVHAPLRGLRGAELRQAVGLHRGRGVLREVANGVLCYFSAIPLLVAGLVVFAVLSAIVTALFGQPEQPSHPVADLFAGADWLRLALVALLATVAAPIVEEIMFRGALYSHLRGTVFERVPLVSILAAAIASSFIFAVIHPQGVLFTPALGGLAVSFCLYRELRGSLIAPMVAHGIQNGVTLALGMTLMS